MKKKLLLLLIGVVLLSGCFKEDDMQGIDIITTSYPLEYLVNFLYGENANVKSIYPDGSNPKEIKFNKKQLQDFSTKTLYSYLGNDKKQSDIALSLKNNNKDLLLIDGSLGIDYEYGIEETWLDPSNMLMIAQNLKTGLIEYVKSSYLNKDIEDNYELIKIELSKLDADFRLAVSSAERNTIVVGSQTLKYLSKYGLNVISLGDPKLSSKTLNEIKTLINNGEIKYIFLLENEEENENVKELLKDPNLKTLEFKTIETVTDEERKADKDYLNLMKENIDLLKEEIYK